MSEKVAANSLPDSACPLHDSQPFQKITSSLLVSKIGLPEAFL